MNVTVVMAYPTCKCRGSCQGCHGGWVGWLVVHVQLCSRFGVLCERLLRLFIDQRSAQQRLEVGRKVQAVTEDG